MRLKQVATGHRLKHKLLLGMIRVFSGQPAPDSARMLFYRPEIFGRPAMAYFEAVLRGPSDWTPWERELMAMFISAQNQCPF